MRKVIHLVLLVTLCCCALASAQQPAPIKALMFVGGCCHDYKKMPGYLAEKVQELANVRFDIRHIDDAAKMVEVFKDPDFGKGYDVIVYDICFADVWQDGDYDAALRVAAAGKPAVFLHCSMHTYRPPRNQQDPHYKERAAIADAKWHALDGMDTRVHDRYQSFTTHKVADHPIVRSFLDPWTTPGDELYNTIKMMPTATPLLTVKSPSSGKTHVVAWINDYRGTRVFSTTLGHDMKTGSDPNYHKLLAYGLLWACGKLDADGKPIAGYSGSSGK